MTLLPSYAENLLNSCPTAGAGVHNWLFRTARVLHRFMPSERIAHELRFRADSCGRIVPDKEITDAVINSEKWSGTKGTGYAHLRLNRKSKGNTAKWPPRKTEQIASICATGFSLTDLIDLSFIKTVDSGPNTERVIDALFPDNPWICVGATMAQFDTRRRLEWQNTLSGLQLIVPNPMTQKTGLTKTGKPSTHCLDNTGPRHYLVIEFDEGSLNQHAAVLYELAQKAPLCLAVSSGGKSLHGWFDVKQSSPELQKSFMRRAVSLGADPATWTRCQFVRMPDGFRNNGNRQSIVYFNPNNIR
jgi:hypothetical protein